MLRSEAFPAPNRGQLLDLRTILSLSYLPDTLPLTFKANLDRAVGVTRLLQNRLLPLLLDHGLLHAPCPSPFHIYGRCTHLPPPPHSDGENSQACCKTSRTNFNKTMLCALCRALPPLLSPLQQGQDMTPCSTQMERLQKSFPPAELQGHYFRPSLANPLPAMKKKEN